MNEDLSVLVLSCDKYSSLLPYFSYLFDKYWGAKSLYRKYISTESIVLEHSEYTPILTRDSNWTNGLQIALEEIKTPYVFLILDDFFLIREIPAYSIERALNVIKAEDFHKYIFHYPHEAFNGKLSTTNFGTNVYRVHQDSPYTMTTQPSIWNVDFFKKCLREGESPWEFELQGSTRVNATINHKILFELINPGFHREAMSRGQLTPEYYQILKHEHLI